MQRKHSIDTLKVFLLLLVISGHFSGLPDQMWRGIYTFHIPAFILISGYLNKSATGMSFMAYLQDRTRRLILPYMIMGVLSYLVWLLLLRNVGLDAEFQIPAWRPLLGMIYGVGTDHWLIHNTPLWFLPCLFSVQILAYWIERLSAETWKSLLPVLLPLAFLLVQPFLSIRLPWSLDTAFLTLPFYAIGQRLGRQRESSKPAERRFWLSLALGGLFLYVGAARFNTPVDLNSLEIGVPVYFYLGALGGTAFWYTLVKFLPPLPLGRLISDHSIVIYGLHLMGMVFVRGLLIHGLDLDPLFHEGEALLIFALSLGTLVIMIPVAYLLGKLVPPILGSKPIRSFRD